MCTRPIDFEGVPYRNTVEFMIAGNRGMYSDPVVNISGEKRTYPVPTYEGLNGALKHVYWQPGIEWYIDQVRVMNPIRTVTQGVRFTRWNKAADLGYAVYLDNVSYQVRAHFEINKHHPETEPNWNENKHHNIAKRMIKRGGRFPVYLGTSECAAVVRPCVFGEGEGYYDNSGEIPFGLMLHGFTYADQAVRDEDQGRMTMRLWSPTMKDGVITFIRPEECTITEHICDMTVKKFVNPHLVE